ncbi:MAG: hypothetical protein JJ956_13185 [Pseudomonadales bacterium]|nr:hypothetical protein [Pseudomonadales bacterium]
MKAPWPPAFTNMTLWIWCLNVCAYDDVIRNKSGQGLEKTGTSAREARHGDFRFGAGREGRHLVDPYSERTQVRQTDS